MFNTICTVAQECQRPENPQHNNLKLVCCENHNTTDLFTAVLLVFRQHNKIKVLCCKHTHNTTEMDAIQRIFLYFFGFLLCCNFYAHNTTDVEIRITTIDILCVEKILTKKTQSTQSSFTENLDNAKQLKNSIKLHQKITNTFFNIAIECNYCFPFPLCCGYVHNTAVPCCVVGFLDVGTSGLPYIRIGPYVLYSLYKNASPRMSA